MSTFMTFAGFGYAVLFSVCVAVIATPERKDGGE